MKKVKFPLLLQSIRGRVGKKFVVKHYGKKIVLTKCPDMSGIIPTNSQLKQQHLFREAVAYAKTIIADTERKSTWQQKLKRTNGVFNEAIKTYMLMVKNKKEREWILTDFLLNKAFKNIPVSELEQLMLFTEDAVRNK